MVDTTVVEGTTIEVDEVIIPPYVNQLVESNSSRLRFLINSLRSLLVVYWLKFSFDQPIVVE